jgi:hypothetical protein
MNPVEAVYSYRAVREDEFDFSAGDTISVYSTPQGMQFGPVGIPAYYQH